MTPRVSIVGLLGIILLAALGMAAVRSGSPYWLSAMTWVVLYWLSVSVLGALFGEGKSRIYWVGFAAFGWIYMLFIHLSLVSTTLSYQMGMGVTRLIEDSRHFSSPPGVNAANGIDNFAEFSQYKIRARAMIDLLLNLAFAYSGGMTALWFASRSGPAREAPHTTVTGGKR